MLISIWNCSGEKIMTPKCQKELEKVEQSSKGSSTLALLTHWAWAKSQRSCAVTLRLKLACTGNVSHVRTSLSNTPQVLVHQYVVVPVAPKKRRLWKSIGRRKRVWQKRLNRDMRAAHSTFWKILGEKRKPKCASTSSTSLTSTHSYNSCTDLLKKTKLFFKLTMQKTGSANMQRRCIKSILEHPTGRLHCTMLLCTPQIVHWHSVACHLW